MCVEISSYHNSWSLCSSERKKTRCQAESSSFHQLTISKFSSTDNIDAAFITRTNKGETKERKASSHLNILFFAVVVIAQQDFVWEFRFFYFRRWLMNNQKLGKGKSIDFPTTTFSLKICFLFTSICLSISKTTTTTRLAISIHSLKH